MTPSPADRSDLEASQAQLLRALIRGDAFPDGFAPDKAAAASRSLRRKREHAIAGAWPALAIALGEDFRPRFDVYARGAPPPALGDGFTDGLAFARTLERGELTDDVRVELVLARAVVCGRGVALRPRRGIFLRVLALREPRRLLVVWRAPALGRRRWVVMLGRRGG